MKRKTSYNAIILGNLIKNLGKVGAMISLKGKKALVTGASRGIGLAIASRLAQLGADVILVSRDKTALEGAISKIKASGGNLGENLGKMTAFAADVSSSEDVAELAKKVLQDFEKIDILVNNAGITRDGLLVRMKDQDWEDVMATNLRSVFLLSRAFVKSMMKAHFGRIINITSVVGQVGNAGQVNYAASKGGVIAFTKSLAREVASRNITVNAIAPGFIETDMTDKLDDATKEELLKSIPLKSLGHVDDISACAAFLASDEARYLTGAILPVNGGMAMP